MRSWGVILGTILLTLLIASDKLFAGFSVGGALIGLTIYAFKRNKIQLKRMAIWLLGSLVATAAATVLLLVIAKFGLTHFSGGNASPYGVSHSSKNLILGSAYGLLNLLTNVGANPVYDNKLLGDLPGMLVHRLWSLTSFVYVIAFGTFLYALWSAWSVARRSVHSTAQKSGVAHTLAQQLIYSTVVAVAVFIGTNHYYAVDARYLTIALFALVVSASVWLRNKHWRWPEDLLLIGSTLVVAIVVATGVAARISDQQTQALATLGQRNTLIAQTLKRHKVDALVGDYWRVLPIKLASHGEINSLPLANCTQPTAALTSHDWQPDLKTHSFAYLITLDGDMLTNFPKCSMLQVTGTYGQPNAIQIIAGTPTKPSEALLFYDQGTRPVSISKTDPTPILPIGLDQLQDTQCSGDTVMNVVAHQDDDLLFLSPDLLHDVQSDKCVRTVYLTAGDSGRGKFYWLSRQLGSEAAYNTMLGIKNATWEQRTVAIAPHEYLTIASLRGNSRISLIFFNLPDGGLQGDGFASSGHQSLSSLHDGTLAKIKSVDGISNYTSGQLVSALVSLMNAYGPSVIHTQADVADDVYPDHSDHITTGLFTSSAAQVYSEQQFGGTSVIPVVRYIGYPIHSYQDNISDEDRSQKEAAFLAYGAYDGGVCHSTDECDQTPTYSAYIARQYTDDSVQP
jgi:LmbE family N-acetylglucosaminyl deacetylase